MGPLSVAQRARFGWKGVRPGVRLKNRDKRLSRLISYIHHTCEYKQYCYVGNTAKPCRLGLFQDSDFAGDLEDSKSTSGGTLCIFGSLTFVPKSRMCKKQTAVSHSSTESEIVSLDTGLRLDVLPALELLDLIVSVFGNGSQISDRLRQPDSDVKKHHKSQRRIDVMKDIDSVPSNVQSSRQEALLYVFEDNEAVIKMIIKGRSPTMRHVSRTHSVALDWLFDRINLDTKIQIKYIDTKNQLADILTKGNFTRDEWNHLLCLFNISHFSSTVCSAAMTRRFQQDSGEERVTAKSKPMMNLIARTPSVVSSSTSLSPEKRYYGKQDPWKSVVAEDRSGQPDKGTDLFEASDHQFHEQFMESFSSTSYSKLDYDRAWSSQEWKSEVTAHDRSGQPDKKSWSMVQQVRPHHKSSESSSKAANATAKQQTQQQNRFVFSLAAAIALLLLLLRLLVCCSFYCSAASSAQKLLLAAPCCCFCCFCCCCRCCFRCCSFFCSFCYSFY